MDLQSRLLQRAARLCVAACTRRSSRSRRLSRPRARTMVPRRALAMLAALLALLALEATEALPLTPRPAAPRSMLRPRADDRRLAIAKYRNEPNAGDGAYRYEFELSDGSRRAEEGRVSAGGALQVRGSFSRPGFDGNMEEVMYYADEGGFHVAKMVPPLGAPPASLIASLVG